MCGLNSLRFHSNISTLNQALIWMHLKAPKPKRDWMRELCIHIEARYMGIVCVYLFHIIWTIYDRNVIWYRWNVHMSQYQDHSVETGNRFPLRDRVYCIACYVHLFSFCSMCVCVPVHACICLSAFASKTMYVFGCQWNRSCQIDLNHVARPMSISIIWVSVYVNAYIVCDAIEWIEEMKQNKCLPLLQHIR